MQKVGTVRKEGRQKQQLSLVSHKSQPRPTGQHKHLSSASTMSNESRSRSHADVLKQIRTAARLSMACHHATGKPYLAARH